MTTFSQSPRVFSLSIGVPPRHDSRSYRLVNARGEPHPVLDDLYDSLEAAWSEAVGWWQTQMPPSLEPIGIGVEVSTSNGDWRTIRQPCS